MKKYNHTISACYLGYVTQAIINNFLPLLFLTFHRQYGISMEKITLIITINFVTQMVLDLLATRFVDRIGYRACAIIAHVASAAGLMGLGILPQLMDPYTGIIVSVMLCAVGGGMIEVIVSPIVEACPTDNKESVMSILHSFYCWGFLFVVLLSTGYFTLFGVDNWRYLAFVWALIPALNSVIFTKVPIESLLPEGEGLSLLNLCKEKVFWILAILMVCAGASEQAICQWASTFAQEGLGVSKTVGDLAGPCVFALSMGLSRVFFAKCSEKTPIEKIMSVFCILGVVGYLTVAFMPINVLAFAGCAICGVAVAVFWPGTFSMSVKECPRGGSIMFVMLALFGDIGCAMGPTVVGFSLGLFEDNLRIALLTAIIFLITMLWGLRRLMKK